LLVNEAISCVNTVEYDGDVIVSHEQRNIWKVVEVSWGCRLVFRSGATEEYIATCYCMSCRETRIPATLYLRKMCF